MTIRPYRPRSAATQALTLAVVVLAACTTRPSTTPAPVPARAPARAVPTSTVATPTASAAATAEPAAEPVHNVTKDDPFYTTNRMDWPGPNRYRSSDGSPGPEYWQQRADYTIAVTLDTAAQSVGGSVRIRYTNNSPDTLGYVWLQLDQNLYRPGSEGSKLYPADSRWGNRGFVGGYQLSDVRVNGRPAQYRVDDTMMRLLLDAPLRAKGGVATISMSYTFRVPEYGSDRMARDGALYEMAQWYPRMAVYDDVRGWNTDPYLGQGEFYLEYGDIEYSITAPAGYTIAGTGTLQNAAQVLSATERARLAQAARSTSVVQVITEAEAKATPTSGTRTWRFRADNVRDVAWAGAPDFRWDATSWNGVLTQAYYQFPKAGKAWESAAEQTQWSVRQYSQLFLPYPYPQATSVAGTVGGMEYPMFVMVRYGSADPASIFGTINHEIGHEWYPMVVGSNERRYAWQDEGINTYINTFANEKRYEGTQRALDVSPNYLKNWRDIVDRGIQSPLMTAPDHIAPAALGAIGYRKPAVVLLALRNYVVGPESFDSAFRSYTRAWAFKHPTPGDFFRSIENYTGKDLSWFWRAFFYSDDVLDIGITGVTERQDSTGRFATVALQRVTSIPFPVVMRVRYANGTVTDVRLPVDIWARGSQFDATIPVPARVVGVRLWPDPGVPDWNRGNDTWGDAPPANPRAPVTDNSKTTTPSP